VLDLVLEFGFEFGLEVRLTKLKKTSEFSKLSTNFTGFTITP